MRRPETWRHEPAAVIAAQHAPAVVAAAGDHLSYRFIEFFTVNIRNPNTRRAYGRWPTLPEACGIVALIAGVVSAIGVFHRPSPTLGSAVSQKS
ncbi:hypothetical protein [Rhizobium leguminosarum]|uniref:hypothetical protein n=1 Tax=Rhizobium leguminosarum TaxID=384 RepID=UPI00102FB295|nr:hypothetical protein [Rhizobium leguminosarum]TBG96052.1 hypothetical protein ELG68_35925 [Rhizobium leguminosarum]